MKTITARMTRTIGTRMNEARPPSAVLTESSDTGKRKQKTFWEIEKWISKKVSLTPLWLPRPMPTASFFLRDSSTVIGRLALTCNSCDAFMDFNSAKARIPVASLHNYRHTLYWYYVS